MLWSLYILVGKKGLSFLIARSYLMSVVLSTSYDNEHDLEVRRRVEKGNDIRSYYSLLSSSGLGYISAGPQEITSLFKRDFIKWQNAWKPCLLIMLPCITGENDAEKQKLERISVLKNSLLFKEKDPGLLACHLSMAIHNLIPLYLSHFTCDHSPEMDFPLSCYAHFHFKATFTLLFNCSSIFPSFKA